jgi:hypothetical protein
MGEAGGGDGGAQPALPEGSMRSAPGGPIGVGGFGQGGVGRGGPGGGALGGSSEFRYNFTFGVRVRNLFNRLNFGPFSGVLTSPFFDEANSALAPRRVDLELRFNF